MPPGELPNHFGDLCPLLIGRHVLVGIRPAAADPGRLPVPLDLCGESPGRLPGDVPQIVVVFEPLGTALEHGIEGLGPELGGGWPFLAPLPPDGAEGHQADELVQDFEGPDGREPPFSPAE